MPHNDHLYPLANYRLIGSRDGANNAARSPMDRFSKTMGKRGWSCIPLREDRSFAISSSPRLHSFSVWFRWVPLKPVTLFSELVAAQIKRSPVTYRLLNSLASVRP